MKRLYSAEFEIQGLPKMSNELLRGGWQTKAAHARRWKNLVRLAALEKIPPQPLTKARLILTRCSAREPDFDGLVSGFKPVVDGLVECGILAGDKQSNIGQPVYLHELATRKRGKIKVKVEEIAQ